MIRLIKSAAEIDNFCSSGKAISITVCQKSTNISTSFPAQKIVWVSNMDFLIIFFLQNNTAWLKREKRLAGLVIYIYEIRVLIILHLYTRLYDTVINYVFFSFNVSFPELSMT